MNLHTEVEILSRHERSEERVRGLMTCGLDGGSAAYQQLFAELGRCLRNYFSQRIASAEVDDFVSSVEF